MAKSNTKILTKLNNLSFLKTENANSEEEKKNIYIYLEQKVLRLEQIDTSATIKM